MLTADEIAATFGEKELTALYNAYTHASADKRQKTVKLKTQKMETTRQAKISRLLQKELSEIFRLQTAKTRGTLISVSSVRVSPDLSVAKVYLSIFPSDKADDTIKNINASAQTIRYELAQRVRYQLRKTPALTFYIDDSLDYIENIDNLLAKG